MPAKIDLEKCGGCGTCADGCPTESIKIIPEDKEKKVTAHAEVDANTCIDCASCVDQCPCEAITIE